MRQIILTPEDDGYVVTVPSLPGCVTQGDTIEEAIAMAKEAIELFNETLEEMGEEIPEDIPDRILVVEV